MPRVATHAVLAWMREHAGPDGTLVVNREVLRQAGIPERFVSRLSSRLHDMARRGAHRRRAEGARREGHKVRHQTTQGEA